MPLKEKKYKQNQAIVKVIGRANYKKIKVVVMKSLRTAGIEDDMNYRGHRDIVNDKKLDCNVRRAKNKIFELAICNPWDFFFTATLDSKKYDRTDLKKFKADLTKWLSNYNRIHNCEIKYLLVPELHSDGKSWHMHGLLSGVPTDSLVRFEVGQRMGKAIAERVKQGKEVYNWPAYMNKFGFCDLEPVRNCEAVSKYVTKYINKGLASCVTEVGAHLYYHSCGLLTAKICDKGYWSDFQQYVPDYEGDYCKVYEFKYSDEMLNEITSNVVHDGYSEPYWSLEHENNSPHFYDIGECADMPF